MSRRWRVGKIGRSVVLHVVVAVATAVPTNYTAASGGGHPVVVVQHSLAAVPEVPDTTHYRLPQSINRKLYIKQMY